MRFGFFVSLIVVASCGGVIAGSDGGSDGGGNDASVTTECSSAADCPSGYECAYPLKGGCQATRKCFPLTPECKKVVTSCSCAGPEHSVLGDCNDAFPEPVMGMQCEGPICSGPSCEVCDTSGFGPPLQVPPNDATNACTSQDISSFVAACLGATATQTTCAAWQNKDAGTSGCFACLVTSDTSATWGPLVCDSASCRINTGGCIDIVAGQVVIENGINGSCGDLTNAADECIDYACGGCTTTPDSDTCAQHAEANECKTYFDAAQYSSTCALFDAGAGTCSPQSDGDWASFLNVFCGTGP